MIRLTPEQRKNHNQERRPVYGPLTKQPICFTTKGYNPLFSFARMGIT
jgi:hypothetical protein